MMAGRADAKPEPHVVFGVHDSLASTSKTLSQMRSGTRCCHTTETSTVLDPFGINASWIPSDNTHAQNR